MEQKAGKKKGKPNKRITWRQVSACFSHRYASVIWENVNNSQVVKIYTMHKSGNNYWIVKVQFLRNGVQVRQLNFQAGNYVFKEQLN